MATAPPSRPAFALLALTLVSSLAACGGGATGPGASCGKVAPCGGDPVGNWMIASSCQLGLKFDLPFCLESTVDASGLATTGMFSLGADLTYSVATTSGGSFEVDLPSTCIAAGARCTDLTPSVQAVLEPMLGPGLQSVTCAGTTICACTVVVLPSDTNETGTYTVSGATFTTTPAGDTAFVVHDFCVEGNTMHIVSLDPTMIGSSGQPAIIFDIVARRR